jgi:hypothetical protein
MCPPSSFTPSEAEAVAVSMGKKVKARLRPQDTWWQSERVKERESERVRE